MSLMPKCKGLNCPVDPKTCKRFNLPTPTGEEKQVWTKYQPNRRKKTKECIEFVKDYIKLKESN